MDVIDEDGFVLGVVNVIDALVILLVLAVLAAGVALVTSPSGDATETQMVTFRSTPQPPYVVEAIAVGPVRTDGIVMIKSKSVERAGNESYVAVLRVRLEITTTPDGLPKFGGQRLYVGRELRLDLGRTIVDGVVVDIGARSAA